MWLLTQGKQIFLIHSMSSAEASPVCQVLTRSVCNNTL